VREQDVARRRLLRIDRAVAVRVELRPCGRRTRIARGGLAPIDDQRTLRGLVRRGMRVLRVGACRCEQRGQRRCESMSVHGVLRGWRHGNPWPSYTLVRATSERAERNAEGRCQSAAACNAMRRAVPPVYA